MIDLANLLLAGCRPVLNLPLGLVQRCHGSADPLNFADSESTPGHAVLTVGSDEVQLPLILNPFARSMQAEVELNDLLHENPEEGNRRLDIFVEQTRGELRDAVNRAGGIVYMLDGAHAGCCSPMEYGGYYLERDRELLEAVSGKILVVLAIVGGDDVFLDFVSDLPAEVFAWNSPASAFSAAYVRSLREGVQASSDPDSEIILEPRNALMPIDTPNSNFQTPNLQGTYV